MPLSVSRLFQPGNPLFWVMVALQILSSVLVWAMNNLELTTVATLIAGGLALMNAVFGIVIAIRLMRGDTHAAIDGEGSTSQNKQSGE